MASKQEVKKYLAHWFQLGMVVAASRGDSTLSPKMVIAGGKYSKEFEKCWQQVISSPITKDYYLEGTDQTINELLTPAWEIVECSRCNMPIEMHSKGMPTEICPCHYLKTWPNTDVPAPRCPVDSQVHLQYICNRLVTKM